MNSDDAAASPSTASTEAPPSTAPPPRHVDVLIVGAGLSGIGAACHLTRALPKLTYVVLEGREATGGTWDLFRYPGIRSDSDMQTFAYRFRPWHDPRAIVDGASVLAYLRETAAEYGVDRRIRTGHRVTGAEWSSSAARWTVRVRRTAATGEGPPESEEVTYTCRFLQLCTGYYRYEHGHTPDFPGREEYTGRVVHPQHWPADLDHSGRRVAVIGSGATAMTLVPALARDAAHVTMVQRSPTYVVPLPEVDPVARVLARIAGKKAAQPVVRWKNILVGVGSYQLGQRLPTVARALIRTAVKRRLPAGFDVGTHFNPRYKPWDQRLCVVPDGDLFRALSDRRAEVVTDHIDTFIPDGLRLASGREVRADVVVTATGLDLLAFGGVRLSVDGAEVRLHDTVTYRGLMLDGVPNLAFTLGYTNASWTLKADLTAAFVCRLLAHLDATSRQVCVPDAAGAGERRPLLDFSAGYVRRSVHAFPQSGTRDPWRVGTNYPSDLRAFRRARLDDGTLRFGGPVSPTERANASRGPVHGRPEGVPQEPTR
ncbi:flavin-containing monooxygenase [Streptomyces sp. NPDC091272]|uniref:flavin-containing monooxygenase n=1 Tax=Streptomyces sp. NPDC091272 TaxID=3365981 RepID=UPI0038006150